MITFFLLTVTFINFTTTCNEIIELVDLSPDRWEEVRSLRMEAIEERPWAIGGSTQDEEKRTEEAYRLWLSDTEDTWFVFAQKDGKLIGMIGAMCKMKHISACRHLVTIVSTYVKPEYRRCGLGTQLLKKLIEKLESSMHVSQAMLFVTATEVSAINLYNKCGFKTVGKLSNALFLNGTSYDQYIMERSIEKN